jgi:hypothetical protein
MRENGYWFRSTQFSAMAAEHEPFDPACFGEPLARWLAEAFAKLGYETSVTTEDWGWCVILRRADFLLWIGCGCADIDPEAVATEDHPPPADELVWHVFATAEVPFFRLGSLIKKWTGPLDLAAAQERLDRQLLAVLAANESIRFCEEP